MSAEDDQVPFDPAVASTLVFVVRTVVMYWKAVGAFTIFMIAIAVLVGLLSTPVFRATVSAYPETSAGAAGGLRGLASSLGLGGDLSQANLIPSVDETMAVLDSDELAIQFIQRHKLMQELFPERWDATRKTWKPPSGFQTFVRSLMGEPLKPTVEPTMDEALLVFDRMRHTSQNSETGVLTLSMDFRDPNLAALWANELMKDADDTLRQRVLQEATAGLTYLQNQAAGAQLANLRDSVYTVAAAQITRSMLARSRTNFAFKIIDQARPPIKKSWPQTSLLVALALLGGLLLGSAAAIFWRYAINLREFASPTVATNV